MDNWTIEISERDDCIVVTGSVGGDPAVRLRLFPPHGDDMTARFAQAARLAVDALATIFAEDE